MAKKRPPNTTSVETRSFQKGMVKDVNESLIPEGAYIMARNAVNNSKAGDLGILGNESANRFCAKAPYPVIGAIHITGDRWAIFSTNDVDSEIGHFDEGSCEYTTIANDPCLGFKRTNPILGGEAKENFDCTWEVYFADDLNPDRSINIDNPPWIQDCITVEDCIECTDTNRLDCELLRMARITIQPCIKMEQGTNGGELLNGTYQAVIAYTENEQRVSDYSIPSNIVSMFDHRNVNGSIDIIIEDIDQTYDEFELVVIGFVNQNMVARKIGIYSTRQNRISLDRIDATLPTVPLQLIPLDRPSYERSQGIYRNGEFLIRVAPTSRFSFNYQPLANQIRTTWVSVEYPQDYYRERGINVGYMRDEVYSFFIRWIYNTNDKTESYHIPGRAPGVNQGANGPLGAQEDGATGNQIYGDDLFFEAYNTAYNTAIITPSITPDNGTIVAQGLMGYWQSTEKYPDNKPDVWGDLCGKNIRHHKMPDNELEPHFNPANGKIRVLGVQFDNIPVPLENDGVTPIPGIVGYEILRGSREGNKTIVAKGLFNNLGSYVREDNNQVAYYQNYPYNDLTSDPFLTNGNANSYNFVSGDENNVGHSNSNGWPALGGINPFAQNAPGFFQQNKHSFHSPDTQFKHPFLSSQELKVYETHYGAVNGQFNVPYKHPEHKLVTDLTFLLASMVGFGIALKSIQGSQKSVRSRANMPKWYASSDWYTGFGTGGSTGPIGANFAADTILDGATQGGVAAEGGVNAAYIAVQTSGADALLAITGGLSGEMSAGGIASLVGELTAQNIPGVEVGNSTNEFSSYGETGLPMPLRVAQAIPTFLAYWSEGTQTFMDLIQAISRKHQYALQCESHGFYGNRLNIGRSGYRSKIEDASYIGDKLQEFGGITVNNLYRGTFVGVITQGSLPTPAVNDQSRKTYTELWSTDDPAFVGKERYIGNTSAHYVGLKTRLRNQYGQMDGIKQIPTSSCMQEYEVLPTNPPNATSGIIFGGDTYIGRYTEKNPFFYFSDWMYDLPDEFEYDYRLRKMMPMPQYWMDTHDFQVNDFLTGVFDNIFNVGSGTGIMPSSWHNFDTYGSFSFSSILDLLATIAPPEINLIIKNAYFYLFNSGVRDFFVESEVNVQQRDWGEEETQRHYDPGYHTNLKDMFRTDRIKAGNFFKYDYSLSASRYYQAYASWGRMQYRNYDPLVAETCYTYYPNRLIYSLPQEKELRYDNWKAYLINNYKDFASKVTVIKPIAKTGAMILFEDAAPASFMGQDTLQSGQGVEITIGDGGLFNREPQSIVNTDQSYEYGSCQDKLSVINTPAGLFWISQNQGKIFNYAGQLEDISQLGMKWWFDEFLPYKLTKDFPDFELKDNTVIGIGCQAIYDNSDGIVYFSKRDFRARPEFVDRMTYVGDDNFSIGAARFKLGDPRYFDDASWTISYDPKSKAWVSFHDWHPNFLLPSKNNFCSILGPGIWIHNDRTDLYCNYYGVNYPFEVELVTPTGQTVNTLRSIEYIMEVFQWDEDGVDRNHVLDFNFDKAVVYNTEQISGELRLNLKPKNNAPAALNYPQVNPSSIDILYSKEEQKYRFNQFWDITDDRGEFTNARRMMFNTSSNGYTKEINPQYVNYSKSPTQRKKFRHYQSSLWLRRIVSGVHNMQLKLVNSKNQYSPR
jgi:hypothetical protein